MLQDAAESDLSTAGRRRHHPRRLPAASELPGHCCSRTSTAAPFARRKATTAVWSFRAAARCSAASADGPSPGHDLEESVEAAPVAAQVAPHRRQVAVCAPPGRCCRLGARRNAAEMKFLSSFDLYVLSSLSPSLLLMEIILNKLETELIELL